MCVPCVGQGWQLSVTRRFHISDDALALTFMAMTSLALFIRADWISNGTHADLLTKFIELGSLIRAHQANAGEDEGVSFYVLYAL